MPTSTLRPRRHRRTLAMLLCAPVLLLAACSATEPSARADVPWPSPAPQPAPAIATPTPWPASVPVVRATPNFEAPSAMHCARPIQTREVPGGPRRTGLNELSSMHDASRPAPRRRSAEALGGSAKTVERSESAAAESRAVAAPMPAAPPSPVAASAAPVLQQNIAAPGRPRPANEAVTAGMVDDNADFAAYLKFRERTQVQHRERDVSERYLLQVRDSRGQAVPDAEVVVHSAGGAAMWARTDTGGRVWLHPRAFDPSGSRFYEVAVRKDGRQATSYLRRGQQSGVDVVLDTTAPTPARAPLDLVFLIDATGSMGDEIAKLKTTLRTIADEVARLPSRPDTCFGLVAYRDRGDAFLLRSHDFTNDLGAFQKVLDELQANGGGDTPEAMNEALNETVHRLSWRGTGTTRLVVLLADAPPHLDYGGPQYDDDMAAALGKGIKVFSVGASGLDKQGEYIQRQIAQYTGGRFVFLTYRNAADPGSGPGSQTVHDVSNYSVQTLDRLVVRLVSEELARLPAGG